VVIFYTLEDEVDHLIQLEAINGFIEKYRAEQSNNLD
jgi:hypothetical protein